MSDETPQITLIPAGTLILLRERSVTLTFHNPDDAIIFTPRMKREAVTLCTSRVAS